MNKSTEIFTFIPLNSLSYQISSSNQIPKQNFYGCSGTIRNTGMASGEPFWVHGLSHHFWGLLVCVESVPEFALRVLAWNVINVVCHRNWGSDWEDWARLRGVPRLTSHDGSSICTLWRVDRVHSAFVEWPLNARCPCHLATASSWVRLRCANNSRDSQGSRKPSWLLGSLQLAGKPHCWCLHSFTHHSVFRKNL